jgi:signal transduction histidine kinase
MPSLDTWLELTLRLPLWLALLFLLLFAGLIAWGFARLRQVVRRMKDLETRSLQAQGGSHASASPSEEAYRQFIYNISHEVSNPLQSIQTNLDNLAKCGPEETGRWEQYHAVLTAEIHRLAALTERLRLLARLETPGAPVTREPVNLKAVIEDVQMALVETAEERHMRLVYDGPNRPARVSGDREALRQALINLVENSIRYAKPQGGEVILYVREQPPRLSVRVCDDGLGIPAEDLPYVFDTAYRAPHTGSLRRSGSGLGLAIVKKIIEGHGGTVTITSQPGEGTMISFDLPLYVPS